jgi:hypothetical protein
MSPFPSSGRDRARCRAGLLLACSSVTPFVNGQGFRMDLGLANYRTHRRHESESQGRLSGASAVTRIRDSCYRSES